VAKGQWLLVPLCRSQSTAVHGSVQRAATVLMGTGLMGTGNTSKAVFCYTNATT
jgi:hypothetical protein